MHGVAVLAAQRATAGAAPAVAGALAAAAGRRAALLLAPWAPLTHGARWLGEALARHALAARPAARAAPGPGGPRRAPLPRRKRPRLAPAPGAAALLVTAAAAAIAPRGHAAALLGIRAAAAAAAAATGAPAQFASLGAAAAGALLLRGGEHLLRRWHAGRRGGWRRGAAPVGATGDGGPGREVAIVTFNIRAVMDRWPERAPLLRDTLAALDADVYCFQEVLTGEFSQERQLLGPGYSVHPCRAALDSVAAAGALGAAYAAATRALLALPPARALMVAAPPAVEGWRERRGLSGAWARTLRDASIAPFFGNSIASRLPQPAGAGPPETLLLGSFRAAQRVCVELAPSEPGGEGSSSSGSGSDAGSDDWGGGGAFVRGFSSGEGGGGDASEPLRVWLVNTHLDHASPEIRERQAQAIIDWMRPLRASCAGVVFTGDLNAPPGEGTHLALQKAGFASASQLANGREPPATWPSGLVAPLMDEGEPHCADYVYVWQAPGHELRVRAARLAGDAPAAGDATLFPSDHFGLQVRLAVARRPG
ncbi:hypothetical protein Rsub_06520 [Raphidocelis subcapitata]|uniref:Endonuclease/exonuclease/phosphatase domain-containing protein n=1 Tax=Raphidocelis subcapitata TaxID=307507 RepID=A0A2V0P8R0_9CHLO|nr:hypothetical protein Rsub_06520 [Raphidocelis subcapitata]|eukprot:GBF94250.1 hypothetical protein Rsub_06520 [Raphidocelis subcapitata]